jgi:hypothetical protein
MRATMVRPYGYSSPTWPNKKQLRLAYVLAGVLAMAAAASLVAKAVVPPGTENDAAAPPSVGDIDAGDETRRGVVNGCNTYGTNCDGNPIYRELPPASGYDWPTWPKITTVEHGSRLEARCWAIGGMTWNYAAQASPPDHGPDPYASDIHFNVRAPNGEWGWIPDTYFVRDQDDRLGLRRCTDTGG